ncbi:MAG: T9SS type A sorting domain-containing protein, partial [Salinivirgaceae bacterium]|nr:T9SS type A sorting domain-containing protein [Salinivirgaceae bacterium]
TTLEYDNYQWLQASNTTIEMEAISGANSSNYNVTITSEDIYYGIEIITNSGCIAQSNRFLINDSLYSKPEIIEPTETFVCRDAIISLELSNQAYSSYQWYKDGSLIWGATSASFEAGANYPGGTGSYNVKVTTELDPNTEFESNTIELTFADQPNISIKDDALLCPGGTVTLEAKPGWNGEVGGYDTYQWYFNDVNDISSAVEISGATDSVIEIDVPAETRYYWVKTSLNGCEDESYAKTIQEFALYAPYISMNPWDGIICMGDTITLKVYSNDVSYQWYYNGEIIEGATEQEYKATMVGYYDIEIASTLCESAAPIMNNDSAVIDYRVKPTYTVNPEGEEYNNDPNHRIFCKGDTVSLMVANPTSYNNYQWYGKLFPINSTTDEWEPITDATQANYRFINGVDNDKLHYKIRVDSIMDNDEICAGFSDYKTIDGWVFQDPAVASYGNSELCDEGDSTLVHIAYPGEWSKIEWYVDGVLADGFDNDTAWANYPGVWIVTAYPEKCPSIPHSSGAGPTVQMMPEAFIDIDEYALFANPFGAYGRVYDYVWYLDGALIDMNTMGLDEHPGYILLEDVISGSYEVVISNPTGCTRFSEPYVIVGVNDSRNAKTRIYPNPFTNNLTIEFENINSIESFEIYNSLGQLITKNEIVSATQTINIETEQQGIFLIKVNYYDKTSKIHKIVKN